MARRLLVTGAGGPAGRALLAQLTDRRVDVLGVDMAGVPDAPAPVLEVPPARDPGYLERLAHLVDLHGIDVIVPTVSEELPIVAAASGELLRRTGARVLVADPLAVRIADDKLATAIALGAAGVPVPRFLAGDARTTGDAASIVGLPLVAKPRVSRGARGVRVVRAIDELGPPDASLILQSFAPGTEYAPVVYVPDAAPRIRPHAAWRSRRGDAAPFVAVLEKTGLTAGVVGNATGVRRVDGPAVDDVAEVAVEAVRAVGLTGAVDLDVRRDADGTPVVLELNARFGANSRSVPELVEHVLLDVDAWRRSAA